MKLSQLVEKGCIKAEHMLNPTLVLQINSCTCMYLCLPKISINFIEDWIHFLNVTLKYKLFYFSLLLHSLQLFTVQPYSVYNIKKYRNLTENYIPVFYEKLLTFSKTE